MEKRAAVETHSVQAQLPGCEKGRFIPILFLLSSLAFLEAAPAQDAGQDPEDAYAEVDGWTPADAMSFLRVDSRGLHLDLGRVRGRAVGTSLTLTHKGELRIRTEGRGQSALRWISYVRGSSHLQSV